MLWWRHHTQAQITGKTKGREEENETIWLSGNTSRCLYGDTTCRERQMNVDFSAVLVILTSASGLIWLFGVLFFVDKNNKDDNGELILPAVVDFARSFFPIFFIVLILRSFIVEPFKIPSASMMPTLLIGDFILVNKYDYGIRLPVLNTKIIENGTPERGDIVVFRYPVDPSIPFIKRVVGLPGDKFLYKDKILYINDEAVEQVEIGAYKAVGSGKMMDGATLSTELLANAEHEILRLPNRPSQSVEGIVPKGHYFVLGDNRDNSKDSRYWGYVPDENLVGRAFMVWMNWDSKNSGVDWKRIGTMINNIYDKG
jgi:signal peptidase I